MCRPRQLHDAPDFAFCNDRNAVSGRAFEQTKATGAQPYLPGRLLARGIEDSSSRSSKPGRNLKQEGRLANARLAADKNHGPRHETASQDAIDLTDATRDPDWLGFLQPAQ
jgi:hypothetical protein